MRLMTLVAALAVAIFVLFQPAWSAPQANEPATGAPALIYGSSLSGEIEPCG